ncbi:MAG: hypothetical protein RLY20_2854 [Verrucomicrobiota bacterium]|jgi:hypothetical protein
MNSQGSGKFADASGGLNANGQRETLRNRLAISRQALGLLTQLMNINGIRRPLEFCYDAPSSEAAEALLRRLQDDRGYVAEAMVLGVGPEHVVVIGVSVTVGLSDSEIEVWVNHMVKIGEEHGCRFDGWGLLRP